MHCSEEILTLVREMSSKIEALTNEVAELKLVVSGVDVKVDKSKKAEIPKFCYRDLGIDPEEYLTVDDVKWIGKYFDFEKKNCRWQVSRVIGKISADTGHKSYKVPGEGKRFNFMVLETFKSKLEDNPGMLAKYRTGMPMSQCVEGDIEF